MQAIPVIVFLFCDDLRFILICQLTLDLFIIIRLYGNYSVRLILPSLYSGAKGIVFV